MILLRISSCLRRKWEVRCKDSSRNAPSCPARTMLKVNSEKIAGCLPIASSRLLPWETASWIAKQVAWSFGFSVASLRILSDSSIGTPLVSKSANWAQKSATCSFLTRTGSCNENEVGLVSDCCRLIGYID